MANPIIGMMAKHAVGNMPQSQMIQRFKQFRQQLGDRDPNQIINGMLRDGRVTQEQVEQARAMAEEMQDIFK